MAGAPHLIPDYLRPVYDFVNTIDIEDETDVLTSPTELAAVLGVPDSPSSRQLRLALDLRHALRAYTLANNEIALSDADAALASRCFARLPVVASSGGLIAGSRDPVLAGLTRIVIGYATAVAAGEWDRLRQCPASDCAWIFWDRSPRNARKWCTMQVCGNRAKARTYASRRRSETP